MAARPSFVNHGQVLQYNIDEQLMPASNSVGNWHQAPTTLILISMSVVGPR
jgi:hypothetical protein